MKIDTKGIAILMTITTNEKMYNCGSLGVLFS